MVVSIYELATYGVYRYNRFFGRIGKIVKIEKYVPFRTSGNRNLYLGCNRRHTASSRIPAKPRKGEIRRVQNCFKYQKVLLGGNATIPVHSLLNGPWPPPRGNEAFGLLVKRKSNDIPKRGESGLRLPDRGLRPSGK
jgi:ribosomal protein S30